MVTYNANFSVYLQTRFAAITMQVFGPRLFSQLLKKAVNWLQNPEHCPELKPEAREHLLRVAELLDGSSFWVGRLNLVLFYIYGKYYRLSQRMTKIHYVSVEKPMSLNTYFFY